MVKFKYSLRITLLVNKEHLFAAYSSMGVGISHGDIGQIWESDAQAQSWLSSVPPVPHKLSDATSYIYYEGYMK